MKSLVVKAFVLGVSAAFLSTAVFAAGTDDPVVQKRMQNQDKRIDQGVKSGELTPKEAGKLEKKEAKIKQDEERMKSDGKLTKKERAKLRREQNRASKRIYKEKHDKQKVNVNQ